MKAAATLFDPHVPSLWYTDVCTFIRACVHLFARVHRSWVHMCVYGPCVSWYVCVCVVWVVCCVLCVVCCVRERQTGSERDSVRRQS